MNDDHAIAGAIMITAAIVVVVLSTCGCETVGGAAPVGRAALTAQTPMLASGDDEPDPAMLSRTSPPPVVTNHFRYVRPTCWSDETWEYNKSRPSNEWVKDGRETR